MSNLTDFFPSGGGGGLTPKFQEFNASGTFTPSQALIDAGGYIEVFLVGGGGKVNQSDYAGAGGEAFFKKLYLTSVSAISVIIGGGATGTGNGGNSSFNASSAGAVNLIALGGLGAFTNAGQTPQTLNASWRSSNYNDASAGNGIFGYGAGGQNSSGGGIYDGKPNSGQGSSNGGNGASGYCLIKWYE